MSAPGRMTMRAALKRDTQASPDPWGQCDPDQLTDVNPALPCFLYSKRVRREVDGRWATVEELRMIVSTGTDIQPGDVVESVKNRNDSVIHPGNLIVQGHQIYVGHWEVSFTDFSQ